MTPRKPVVRAVKARRRSRVACGCWLQVGTYIIRGPDGRSKCAACVISSLQAAERVLRRRPRRTEGDPAARTFHTGSGVYLSLDHHCGNSGKLA